MPAIAIRERMNCDQPMVKSDRSFIRRMDFVLHPVANVAEKRSQPFVNLVERNAQIFLRPSVLSSPFPSLAEHLPVQPANVSIRDDGMRANRSRHGPASSQQDVLALPLVELFFGSKTRNQVGEFLRRKGSRTTGPLGCHRPAGPFSRRRVSSSIFCGTPPTAWSSRAIECSTARTFSDASSRAERSASSRTLPCFGTRA